MATLLGDEYVTVTEAAKLLNVSPSTIWRWIDQGTLAAYRIGHRRVCLKKTDLTSMITPARRQEKGAGLEQTERLSFPPLTRLEQERALEVIATVKKLQAEMLKRRGGKLFTPSHTVLDELREERTRALQ